MVEYVMCLHPICLLCRAHTVFSLMDASSNKFSRFRIYASENNTTIKNTTIYQGNQVLGGQQSFFFFGRRGGGGQRIWPPRRAEPAPVIHRATRFVEIQEISVFFVQLLFFCQMSYYARKNSAISLCVSSYPAWIP